MSQKVSNSKLDFYSQVKTEFGYSPYLSKGINQRERRALVKLRISAHNLPVETGRYNDDNGRDKRICPFCSTSIGNEQHYLTECPSPLFTEHRSLMTLFINKKHPEFMSLDNKQKAIFLLKCTDPPSLSNPS